MFPFMTHPSCFDSYSSKAHKERKLKFLKLIRDELETRLAGVNAAIASIENQINREETTE